LHFCNFSVCESPGIDLVFVLDSSASITKQGWEIIKNFTVDVARSLTIGPDDSLIGVIEFGTTVQFLFNLTEHKSATPLIGALGNLPFLSSSTNTGGALQLLLSSAQDGTMGIRNGRTQIAIVVTDGISTNRQATLDAARDLHAAGIFQVYAAGLGGADITELNAIASDPSLVFFSDQFNSDSVKELTENFTEIVCSKYIVYSIL